MSRLKLNKIAYDEIDNKPAVKLGVQAFLEKGPKEIQGLAKTDPLMAKEVLAQAMAGKDHGFRYTIIKKGLVIETLRVNCDSCQSKFPLQTTDFSNWTRHGSKDYCPSCS